MRQNVANVDAAKPIVDFGNQTILIALDVENRPLADGIRGGKSLPDVR
jgi:hypothetical protein